MPKQVGDYSYVEVIQEYYNYVYPESKETITANDEFYKKTHYLIRSILKGFYFCMNGDENNDKLPDVPLNFYQKEYLIMILKDYYNKKYIDTDNNNNKLNVYKLCRKIINGKFSAITPEEKKYLLLNAYHILSENIPDIYNKNELDRFEWQSLVDFWQEEIEDSINAFEAEKNFTKRFEKMWAKLYNECYSKEPNENIVAYCEYGNRCGRLAPDSIFSVNHDGFGQFGLLNPSDRWIILNALEERLSKTLQDWKNDVEVWCIGPEIGLI